MKIFEGQTVDATIVMHGEGGNPEYPGGNLAISMTEASDLAGGKIVIESAEPGDDPATADWFPQAEYTGGPALVVYCPPGPLRVRLTGTGGAGDVTAQIIQHPRTVRV